MQLIQAQPVIDQLKECLELLQSCGLNDHQVASNIQATLDAIEVELTTAPIFPDEDEEEEEDKDRRRGLYGPEYPGEQF